MRFRSRALQRLALLAREIVHLQLLIALEGGDPSEELATDTKKGGEAPFLVGGQAVMEGVMMRTPHSYAIAVRHARGELVTTQVAIQPPAERRHYWRWPLLRGLATLGQAMALGVRALRFSSDQLMDGLDLEGREAGQEAPAEAGASVPDPPKKEISSLAIGLSVAGSLIFFIAFYKFLPLLVAHAVSRAVPAFNNQILFNLVDGSVRILLFVLFLLSLSLFRDIRRVYQYHGAEHKVVYNFESGQPVDVEHAQTFTTLHPRCGTSFMIVIMLIAMAVYMLVPVHGFVAQLLVRIALLPLIAGLSYEVIRYAAKHNGSVFAWLARPGLWLQRVTTQPPDASQLECSIRALGEAMALEAEQGGPLVIA